MRAIILVVDDNPELVDGVKLTLEMEGYQVLAAASGSEALTILERITPDLILADIMMPGMDGYELYERVHSDERWVRVPFIFLTAKTSQTDVRLGKEMGADDYITKPFDSQDMVATVRGRLKRMAEVTGRPTRGDVVGGVRFLWYSKLGPLPMPLIIFAIAALLMTVPFFVYRDILREAAVVEETSVSDLPPRPDTGEMVSIPEGTFLMGGESPGASQPRQVHLDAFQIDRYEVTNAQYRAYVEEAGALVSKDVYVDEMADFPVTNVSWEDARAYCDWAGKRLPTEAEWEKAARGTEGFVYPWGDEWRDGMANTSESGIGSLMPVGSFPEGASPYGVEDMAGNVSEWVEGSPTSGQETQVIRGGAWNAISRWAQTFAHNEVRPTYTQDNLGFRCVY